MSQSQPFILSKMFTDVPIAATTAANAVIDLISRARSGPATTYRLLNAGTFDACATTIGYLELLTGEGINLPDGKPLSIVMQRTAPKNVPCEQVRGPWLFESCLDRGREVGLRHFLLGTTEQTLYQLLAQIELRFPGVVIAGTYSPPFRDRSQAELTAQDKLLGDSGADIVWVALGTPKQDAEALRIFRSTGITTAAVGAAFDFTAGTRRIAPAWSRSLHLEWLFRLATEPRRLWRRYLIGNLRFLVMVILHFSRGRA